MNVTPALLSALVNARPTDDGGIALPCVVGALYLCASDRYPDAWALGFATPERGGFAIGADTLAELQGATCAGLADGSYYTAKMERRVLTIADGWAVAANLPDAPPPPPPPR